MQPGSVVVTLEAASWSELEAANAQLGEGLELPSFGTLEKEAAEEVGKSQAACWKERWGINMNPPLLDMGTKNNDRGTDGEMVTGRNGSFWNSGAIVCYKEI